MIAAAAGLAAVGSLAIGPADSRPTAAALPHPVSQDSGRVTQAVAQEPHQQPDVASYAIGGAGCLLAGAGLFVVLRRRNALSEPTAF
jgi:hypothetical protein